MTPPLSALLSFPLYFPLSPGQAVSSGGVHWVHVMSLRTSTMNINKRQLLCLSYILCHSLSPTLPFLSAQSPCLSHRTVRAQWSGLGVLDPPCPPPSGQGGLKLKVKGRRQWLKLLKLWWRWVFFSFIDVRTAAAHQPCGNTHLSSGTTLGCLNNPLFTSLLFVPHKINTNRYRTIRTQFKLFILLHIVNKVQSKQMSLVSCLTASQFRPSVVKQT